MIDGVVMVLGVWAVWMSYRLSVTRGRHRGTRGEMKGARGGAHRAVMRTQWRFRGMVHADGGLSWGW